MCFRYGASSTVARRESQQGGVNRLVILMLLIVLSSISMAFIAGCSGGGKSGTPGTNPTPTPTPTPTPAAPVAVKASIFWGPRSRATTTSSQLTTGPSSALSASITLKGASTTGGDLTVKVDRDTTQVAGYTGTYTLSGGMGTPGSNFALHVDFYSQAGEAGSIVATADTAVGGASINKDGTLSAIITTTGTIQSVVLGDVSIAGTAQNGTLQVGQTADVTYAAYDGLNGTGNLIAVTPGSGFVTVTGGSAALTAQGDRVVAAAPTIGATITVTVDPGIGGGITSPAKTIKIGSSAAVVLTATNPPGGTASAPIASPGIPLTITATVTGDPSNSGAGAGVTFLLKEGSAAGTLTATTTPTASVVYTPPTTLPATPVTYHIVATSNYDPNVSVTIPITVESLVTVTLTPSTTQTISIKATQQFNAVTALVPTGSDAGVTYTVADSTGATITTGGTISSSGLYTSPATPGTYYIKATSNFDPSKFALVAVVVKSLAVITVTPSAPSAISINATQAFSAVVTNVPTGQSTAVTYTIKEGSAGGTITPTGTTGTTATYTAPATVGTYHIVVTSVFDPNTSVTIPITVVDNVFITATPKSATLSINQSQQFTGFAGGVPTGGSTAVTWSIQEGSTGGTITSGGLYTAPASVSNPSGTVFHVVATSVFDPTTSVVIPVTVGSGSLGIGVN